MKLKKIILSSLLLAIGMVLHQITPPILAGVKPDFSLVMMFIAIIITDDYKTALIIGLADGVLAAATTGFPGGQIPNIIDKLITANCIYFIHKALKTKFNNGVKLGSAKIAVITCIGTLISGTVFLSSALLIFGLPAPLSILFITIVLPTAAINTIVSIVLFNAVTAALKNSAF